MKDLDQSRLASLLAFLVGLWVLLSPIWISMPSGAVVSTIITGVIIAAMGIIQAVVRSSVPSWIMGLAAVWLFLSIFVFGVGAGAAWSMLLSAVAMIILASWDGVEVEHFTRRHLTT